MKFSFEKTLQLFRTLGLLMALGSLMTFIVMNLVVESSSDALLIYHERLFVSAVSRMVTMPGVWLMVGAQSVSALVHKDRLAADGWLVQLGLAALILINTTLVIRPLLMHVTAIAAEGAAHSQVLEAYSSLKARVRIPAMLTIGSGRR